MTEETFWALIQQSRGVMRADLRDGNMSLQEEELERLLCQLDASEVISFRDHFHAFMTRAYDYELWAVAEVIAGAVSDDWFDYFRAWLVSMGREPYEIARSNPEAVEEVMLSSRAEDIFFETIMYVPNQVYEQKTGETIPYPEAPELAPSGRRWRTEADLRDMFPRLFAKYRATH